MEYTPMCRVLEIQWWTKQKDLVITDFTGKEYSEQWSFSHNYGECNEGKLPRLGVQKLLWGQVDTSQAKSWSEKSQSDETARGKSKEGKELGLCEEETVSAKRKQMEEQQGEERGGAGRAFKWWALP